MFKKLKEKLGNWAKNIAQDKEEKQEVETPVKFDIAKQKYEPDLEKISKKEQELIEKSEQDKKTIEEKQKEQLKRIEQAQEQKKEQEKKEEKEEKQGIFKKITTKISKVKISEQEFDVYAQELEMLLLENNVALEVAEKIIQELKDEIVGKELLKKEIEEEIKDVFKQIIRKILIDPFDVPEKVKNKSQSEKKPYIILFCGINGTGKTTTIAKVAEQLKSKDLTCVLAAADTFRAASIEQINKHGEKLGVKVISHEYGADPAAVAYDAIKYAEKNRIDAVLIDTAGRMYTEKNLMKEIEKIAKVANPDLKLFVGESITGNDAIEQAKSFNWSIGIDGIILSKADIDEKGGTALSVGYVTKKPILYLGTGQEYNKIEPFNKEKFIERLGL